MRLANKVAIVTGGGSGIGRATAELFADEGASVAIADVTLDGAEAVAAGIVERGGKAVAVACDVSSSAQAEAAVQATVEAFGGLDILIGNAGIRVLGRNGVADMTEEEWDRTFAINTRGNFLMSKFCLPEMRKRGGGSIAFTASVTALGAQQGYVAYGASKAAVVSMTRTMAVDLGPDNIRVNCVCPGGVRTAITEQSRATMGDQYDAIVNEVMRQTVPLSGSMMDPIEIAQAFLYLSSDDARMVSGANLVVDGAWSPMLARAKLS